jgi:hypothetical protein
MTLELLTKDEMVEFKRLTQKMRNQLRHFNIYGVNATNEERCELIANSALLNAIKFAVKSICLGEREIKKRTIKEETALMQHSVFQTLLADNLSLDGKWVTATQLFIELEKCVLTKESIKNANLNSAVYVGRAISCLSKKYPSLYEKSRSRKKNRIVRVFSEIYTEEPAQ